MKRILLTISIFFAILLCGCSVQQDSVAVQTTPAQELRAAVTVTMQRAHTRTSPFSIEPRQYAPESSSIIFPYILDESEAAAHANAVIAAAIEQMCVEIGQAIDADYTVVANRCGLFSVLLHLYDVETGEQIAVYPINIFSDDGTWCTIGLLMATDDDTWRGVMPDIIIEQATLYGLTLLSDVNPIADDRPFFIDDESNCIVLLYRPYEITTTYDDVNAYDIPIADISPLAGESSLITGLLD